MTRYALVALAALAGTAAAQSSVVSIFLPQFDEQPLVASVIAAGPTATTYALGCPAGVDPEDCDVGPVGGSPPTVIAGPATWSIHFLEEGMGSTTL